MYAAYFVATSCLIRKDRATSPPRHDFVTQRLQKKHWCRLAGYCGAIRSSDAIFSSDTTRFVMSIFVLSVHILPYTFASLSQPAYLMESSSADAKWRQPLVDSNTTIFCMNPGICISRYPPLRQSGIYTGPHHTMNSDPKMITQQSTIVSA